MAASGPPGGLDAKPRAELSALMSSSPTNERTDSIPVEGREPGRPGFRGHRMQGSGLMAWLRRYTEGRPDHILAIGFTMIEMLIVMAIIGTLLAIALPMLRSALDTARVTRAIGDISTLQTDIASFEAAGEGLPETLADIDRATLLDPWGRPYEYLNFHIEESGRGKSKGVLPPGARKDRFLVPINSTYDLYSVGRDGKTVAALTAKASKDDVVRANDGGFIGLAVKY